MDHVGRRPERRLPPPPFLSMLPRLRLPPASLSVSHATTKMASSLLPTPTSSRLLPLFSSSSRPSPPPSRLFLDSRSRTRKWVAGFIPLDGHQRHPSGSFAVKAVAGEAAPVPDTCEAEITKLKLNLLSVASGLNRGLAANEDDLRKVDVAAKELEAAGGPVDLYNDLEKLQGRWRLVYSSAFSSRTLGGSRPGPPTGRLVPISLGQVFQRIDILCKDFDNIVELEISTPWPLPKAEATATLAHKFELIGSCKIKITFVSTTVKPTGTFSQLPPLDIPRLPDGLRPPSNPGTGEFEVTYADSNMRITRGYRGELRVFVIA